jgi:hypothetical protein
MVTMVLLKVAWMCATPLATFFGTFFLLAPWPAGAALFHRHRSSYRSRQFSHVRRLTSSTALHA